MISAAVYMPMFAENNKPKEKIQKAVGRLQHHTLESERTLLSDSVHTVIYLYNNSATIHIHLYNNIYSEITLGKRAGT